MGRRHLKCVCAKQLKGVLSGYTRLLSGIDSSPDDSMLAGKYKYCS
jgi:hypothetical protein